jgi:hypothetical protein
MLVKEIASFDPEAPETIESRGKDEVKNSLELAQISLPPADSAVQDGGKKRKC